MASWYNCLPCAYQFQRRTNNFELKIKISDSVLFLNYGYLYIYEESKIAEIRISVYETLKHIQQGEKLVIIFPG